MRPIFFNSMNRRLLRAFRMVNILGNNGIHFFPRIDGEPSIAHVIPVVKHSLKKFIPANDKRKFLYLF